MIAVNVFFSLRWHSLSKYQTAKVCLDVNGKDAQAALCLETDRTTGQVFVPEGDMW